MIPYPDVSPDIVSVGPIRLRWYGLMYVIGFLVGRQILLRLSRSRFLQLPHVAVDDFLLALFVGMLVGARLTYMVIYYVPSPEAPFRWWYTPFAVWEGGLSFHGGVLGMLIVCWIFSRKFRVPFFSISDSLTLAAPVGIALGRIGNFVNAELYGREASVPWAMRFPIRDFDGTVLGWTTPRHPSQLYESLGEGLATLVVVWLAKRYARRHGMVTAIGIIWYGFIRFFLEFFREKDPQMPYYFGWMTMGQILCAGMVFIGIPWLILAYKRGPIIAERSDFPD